MEYLEEKFDDALGRRAWDEALEWLERLQTVVSEEEYRKLAKRWHDLSKR